MMVKSLYRVREKYIDYARLLYTDPIYFQQQKTIKDQELYTYFQSFNPSNYKELLIYWDWNKLVEETVNGYTSFRYVYIENQLGDYRNSIPNSGAINIRNKEITDMQLSIDEIWAYYGRQNISKRDSSLKLYNIIWNKTDDEINNGYSDDNSNPYLNIQTDTVTQMYNAIVDYNRTQAQNNSGATHDPYAFISKVMVAFYAGVIDDNVIRLENTEYVNISPTLVTNDNDFYNVTGSNVHYIYDDTPNAKWLDDTMSTDESTFTYDLGASLDIDRIRFENYNDPLHHEYNADMVKIEESDDNENFNEVQTRYGRSAFGYFNMDALNINSKRYIKISIKNAISPTTMLTFSPSNEFLEYSNIRYNNNGTPRITNGPWSVFSLDRRYGQDGWIGEDEVEDASANPRTYKESLPQNSSFFIYDLNDTNANITSLYIENSYISSSNVDIWVSNDANVPEDVNNLIYHCDNKENINTWYDNVSNNIEGRYVKVKISKDGSRMRGLKHIIFYGTTSTINKRGLSQMILYEGVTDTNDNSRTYYQEYTNNFYDLFSTNHRNEFMALCAHYFDFTGYTYNTWFTDEYRNILIYNENNHEIKFHMPTGGFFDRFRMPFTNDQNDPYKDWYTYNLGT